MKKLVFSILISLTCAVQCFGLDTNIADLIMPEEKDQFVANDLKQGDRLWQAEAICRQIAEGKYLIQEKGKGIYGDYGDVRWEFAGEYFVQDNNLIPVKTKRIIKNEQGTEIEVLSKNYLAAGKKIQVVKENIKGKREYFYKIKGNCIDSKTLALALRFCVKEDKQQYSFYYLTDEPGMHDVYIRKIDSEKVNGIPAIKYQFFPDLKILNLLLHPLYPKAFIWFSQEYPYQMLKYQGPEMGPFSTKIIIQKEVK